MSTKEPSPTKCSSTGSAAPAAQAQLPKPFDDRSFVQIGTWSLVLKRTRLPLLSFPFLAPRFKSGGAIPDWDLEFGTSLELGTWTLELSERGCLAASETHS